MGNIENATETVTIKASRELLEQMQEGWSPPVRAMAGRNSSGEWEIAFVSPSPQIRAQIDVIWSTALIPYLPFAPAERKK